MEILGLNRRNALGQGAMAKKPANSTSPMLLLSDKELLSRLCPETTLEAWTFTTQEIREALRGERLLCPSIDLSSACNLDCPYCYMESPESSCKKNPAEGLSFAQLGAIICQLADAGARTINIIGAGEPTIDPRFRDVVELIHTKGIRVLVATNGISLARDSSLVRFLTKAKASIVLKVNSRDQELQDRLVGRKGYAAQRDLALSRLLAAGFNIGKPSRLAFNTLLMKANYNEMLAIHKFCRTHNIVLIAGDYMPTGRTTHSEFHGEAALAAVQDGACLAVAELYSPLSAEERQSLREQMAVADSILGLSTTDNPAYVCGLPCIQTLGICIDNAGRIWHCPARNILVDGQLEPVPLSHTEMTTDFKVFWAKHPYCSSFRFLYNGGCPYKEVSLSGYKEKEANNAFYP